MLIAPIAIVAITAAEAPRLVNFAIGADETDPVRILAAQYHYDVVALWKAYQAACSPTEFSFAQCNLYFRAWMFAFNVQRAHR